MKVIDILSSIDVGAIALPEFQRGYVWNRDQVRGLMHSLYRRYPVGSLLMWLTRPDIEQVRGKDDMANGPIRLLLDGQQRVTSLYGIIRGKPPEFFQGVAQAFTDLYFHLGEEVFEFYGPLKMKGNPLWVSVTDLMQSGPAPFISRLITSSKLDNNQLNIYINRLTAIENIKQIDLHVEDVAGADKTIEIVVDIFNRVNSGGTMLSKGDLALARVGAEWPGARSEMNLRLEQWRRLGFSFRLEWFLRCINAVLTGNALFTALADYRTAEFQKALIQTEHYINTLLELVATRLGLDNDRVLGSRYSFPLLARYLSNIGGAFTNTKERDRLLFWYVHTFLWGRYAGSTESVLNQDLTVIKDKEGAIAIDHLIDQLRQNRTDLHLTSRDFSGWAVSDRFYPVIYMLTRAFHARDWVTGYDFGIMRPKPSLRLFNIFSKESLRSYGYTRPEANAIANYGFVSPETLPFVSTHVPAVYLEKMATEHPGVLESHWIPTDPDLWRVENYRDFLQERRNLLAQATNRFLTGLLEGTLPEPVGGGSSDALRASEEWVQIQACNSWVMQQGLPKGETMYEVLDPKTSTPFILDLAWPSGIQEGYSEPVCLLLSETDGLEKTVEKMGYQVFTSVASLKHYVRHKILALN